MKSRLFLAGISLLLAGCAPRHSPPPSPLGAMPFAVDRVETEQIADGVTHTMIRSSAGPWTINVLSIRLDRCTTVEAVPGAGHPLGREKTSDLLAELAQGERVLGGVNADFFNLRTGTPTNLLVASGAMRTPPIDQPVLAVDSAGIAHVEFFSLVNGVLVPFHPLQAVGGRPVLVRDSMIAAEADTFGSAGFRGRNPRTAAGIARNGTRLILAAIDGRTPHDAGMTLRETAALMLALGAPEAINLDGGGSTTMVVADPDSAGRLRVVNHPSDNSGERAVGDAMAVVQRCGS